MNIQQSYREATVRGASPVQLVVRLYEQMIEDLRQAAAAIEQKQIEQRTKRINHAILVIGHLQSTLDSANGSEVAQNLDRFYNVLRQNLVQVQFYPSKRALCQQITDLLVVREAWIEVERVQNSPVTNAAGTVFLTAGPNSDLARMEWKG
jgi:flagellar secretion chaperone FliS